MKVSEMKKYVDFNNKVYEKMSMREVLENFESVASERGFNTKSTLISARNKISSDLYAYKDSNNRWRAGRLAKQNTGQFITGKSARSLRGNATKQISKINDSIEIINRTGESYKNVNAVLDKQVELKRKYRENIKMNPDVDKQIIYGNTVQDIFGNDWTSS